MTGMFPLWFSAVASLSIIVAVLCAVWVTVDVVRRPQAMAVMNVVWPVTMLFGSVAWLTFYRRSGRATPRGAESTAGNHSMTVAVATGTSHCGAGCAIGDLVAEFSLAAFPALGVLVGLGRWYQDEIFAGWILDFVLAFALGIVFQYLSIAPMRSLGLRAGLIAALKADTLSISAWQVGMYGVMALAQFFVLPAVFGGRANVVSPEFWFVMQIAMLAGFATAYPVNWALIRAGIKEKM
ncbi:uncharacterized protein DUF4396 [Curtobacterium sp. PhB142]|uniref:DUF4396 domain-containing protein n=1 Tax=unclassified Curtobacterium TaxID=257496 RepID=UPI00104BF236|nr:MULTISPECIES: DUF4396 domain-containing protein [unclassified Curtobacterium]TCL78253.1 uncharacterized protein DUF4396 [Curtobacterium sp. PhB142]TCL98403.1 uncharacterized protein DUF4396 [Curtobacterium sp. PhB134]